MNTPQAFFYLFVWWKFCTDISQSQTVYFPLPNPIFFHRNILKHSFFDWHIHTPFTFFFPSKLARYDRIFWKPFFIHTRHFCILANMIKLLKWIDTNLKGVSANHFLVFMKLLIILFLCCYLSFLRKLLFDSIFSRKCQWLMWPSCCDQYKNWSCILVIYNNYLSVMCSQNKWRILIRVCCWGLCEYMERERQVGGEKMRNTEREKYMERKEKS